MRFRESRRKTQRFGELLRRAAHVPVEKQRRAELVVQRRFTRREFEASGLLYCHFEVFGAAAPGGRSALEAAVELRGRDGEVVRREPRRSIEPTLDGRFIRFLSFPLDGLAEGDYELRLQVEDRATEEVQEHAEPLRLRGGAAPR